MSIDISRLNDKEKKAIRGLKSAAKKWPDTLWLFSASGSLYVMKKKDGLTMMNQSGGVDYDYIVDKIDIENDGGDW